MKSNVRTLMNSRNRPLHRITQNYRYDPKLGQERNFAMKKPMKRRIKTHLEKSVDTEHSILTNTAIVRLPKMPFGKHNAYNSLGKIKDNHILPLTDRRLNTSSDKDFTSLQKKIGKINKIKRRGA